MADEPFAFGAGYVYNPAVFGNSNQGQNVCVCRHHRDNHADCGHGPCRTNLYKRGERTGVCTCRGFEEWQARG